jgi:hypothetical protein
MNRKSGWQRPTSLMCAKRRIYGIPDQMRFSMLLVSLGPFDLNLGVKESTCVGQSRDRQGSGASNYSLSLYYIYKCI